ncbi:MAG: transporter permease [Mycobacterium sp.]|nr:transporter permease [Mycobacterium sp.]
MTTPAPAAPAQPSADPSPAQPSHVLELTGEWTPPSRLLRDLAGHLDLLWLLGKQDFNSRYRSASLGLLWSVFLPLLQGVVIAVVFSHLVGGGNVSVYVPYVITGITAWSYLQQSVSTGATSIVDAGAIAGKIYFPRLILPAIAASANLPGLVISLVIAWVVALGSGAGLHWTLVVIPGAVALAWLLAVLVSAVASLAHVYSRDIRYVVQAGLLVLFYATPVIYFLTATGAVRALPAGFQPLVVANPATGVVQLTRFALTGHADLLGPALLSTTAWLVGLAAIAVLAYSRFERVACDRL